MSAIEFAGVSKRLSLDQHHPRSFREALIGVARSPRRKNIEGDFWALRDVSFEIHGGETLGFIGPNGAGKSSLLKLIARIYEPTCGRITVNGRVSALLELGTGFHPELTGRENIYLSGAIMGLDRATVQQNLDSIIEFSGLERFIDAPVKHYSSGMYVRLGFAVAIHVRPSIMLIDEVLSVGDQSFQARCLEKILSLQQEGVTIVLVSHDLDAVRSTCQRCLWLDQGMLKYDGDTEATLGRYLEHVWSTEPQSGERPSREGSRWGSGEALVEQVEFLDSEGRASGTFYTGDQFIARLWYRSMTWIERPAFGTAIYRDDGTHVTGPNTAVTHFDIDHIEGSGYVDYIIEHLPLVPGTYAFTAAIYDYHSIHPYDHRHQQYTFRVCSGDTREKEGVVVIPCRWVHKAQ